MQTFAPLAHSSRVRWRVALQDGLVAFVDRDALRQILLNLLDNAVKYGPAGQTVTVGLVARDDRARLWVDDEGPGVAAERAAEIWHPFARLRREAETSRPGAGLGLAVVRELVAMHGDTARVEEAPGGGALRRRGPLR